MTKDLVHCGKKLQTVCDRVGRNNKRFETELGKATNGLTQSRKKPKQINWVKVTTGLENIDEN